MLFIRAFKDPKVRTAYLFIAGTFILVLIFKIIPVIVSLWLSFYKWDIVNPIKLVGFKHYQDLIVDDIFWLSLRNTIYYVAGAVPGGVLIALALALIVNANWFKGRTLIRAVYFIPVIVSMTVVALIWSWIYHPTFGLLNWFLQLLNIAPKMWLSSPYLAMPSIIIMSIWKSVGYYMVIFLAGLQGIPPHYYEAATIDGATGTQLFRYITWPLLKPTTLFVTVIGTINSMQVFDQVYVMTGGGPVNLTKVVIFYLWQNAFEWLKMGYASSIAWGVFIIIFIFTMVQLKLYGEETEY